MELRYIQIKLETCLRVILSAVLYFYACLIPVPSGHRGCLGTLVNWSPAHWKAFCHDLYSNDNPTVTDVNVSKVMLFLPGLM